MLHTIRRKQILKADVDTIWDFISRPDNLGKITPPGLNFFVLTDLKDKKMFPGQIVEYYISPFKGITTHWVTEITHVRDKEFFVDEQRFGPYKFWHHQHLLKPVQGGVEMIDIVHYKLPFGWLGNLVNQLIVKNKLDQIFNFRYKILDEFFNNKKTVVEKPEMIHS